MLCASFFDILCDTKENGNVIEDRCSSISQRCCEVAKVMYMQSGQVLDVTMAEYTRRSMLLCRKAIVNFQDSFDSVPSLSQPAAAAGDTDMSPGLQHERRMYAGVAQDQLDTTIGSMSSDNEEIASESHTDAGQGGSALRLDATADILPRVVMEEGYCFSC